MSEQQGYREELSLRVSSAPLPHPSNQVCSAMGSFRKIPKGGGGGKKNVGRDFVGGEEECWKRFWGGGGGSVHIVSNIQF